MAAPNSDSLYTESWASVREARWRRYLVRLAGQKILPVIQIILWWLTIAATLATIAQMTKLHGQEPLAERIRALEEQAKQNLREHEQSAIQSEVNRALTVANTSTQATVEIRILSVEKQISDFIKETREDRALTFRLLWSILLANGGLIAHQGFQIYRERKRFRSEKQEGI